MPRPMYTPEKMETNLLRGDIGEAFFRLWFENHANNVILRQFGFNPQGVVDVAKKELKKQSFPDFAIFDNSLEKPILGISINTQKGAYNVYATAAPYCFKCPRLEPWFHVLSLAAQFLLHQARTRQRISCSRTPRSQKLP